MGICHTESRRLMETEFEGVWEKGKRTCDKISRNAMYRMFYVKCMPEIGVTCPQS
jgi:hypothetical protein